MFAGVLVYGKRVLPGIVLGTIGTALLGGATLSEALLLSTIDLAYAFIMIFATRWTLGEKRMIDEVIATRNFLLLVILIALPLYSILGSTILSIFYPEKFGDISLKAIEWWTGDVVAAVFLGSSLTLFLDSSWYTQPLNLINLYGYGRLSWNTSMSKAQIYEEWL